MFSCLPIVKLAALRLHEAGLVHVDGMQGRVAPIGALRTRPVVAGGDQSENSWANKAVSQNAKSAYFQVDLVARLQEAPELESATASDCSGAKKLPGANLLIC